MLLSALPSNINAADTIKFTVVTGEEGEQYTREATIKRDNGGEIRLKLLPEVVKYSKGLKQKLIDVLYSNKLQTGEGLYFRYVLKDADGNTTTSDWKQYTAAGFSATDEETFKVEQEGTYEIQYAVVSPTATISTDPTAKSGLTITGTGDLVNSGTATNGTLRYAISTDGSVPQSTDYSSTVPTVDALKTKLGGTLAANTYYVYYYVKGDTGYSDSAAKFVAVTITG